MPRYFVYNITTLTAAGVARLSVRCFDGVFSRCLWAKKAQNFCAPVRRPVRREDRVCERRVKLRVIPWIHSKRTCAGVRGQVPSPTRTLTLTLTLAFTSCRAAKRSEAKRAAEQGLSAPGSAKKQKRA
jgi:hypothetical protein